MTAGKIYKQMALIMADIAPIAKERRNQQQGYQFRGIDDVYQAVQQVMAKHGVFSLPTVLEDRTEDRTTKSGSALIYRILKIKYDFYAEDGSSVTAVVIGEGMDSGDKASNKAMSVAEKYCLLQAYKIPTEEPKDPENDSHETAAKPKPQATAQPKQQTKPGNLTSRGGKNVGFTQGYVDTVLANAQAASAGGPPIYDSSKPAHKTLFGTVCKLLDVTDPEQMKELSAAVLQKQVDINVLDEAIMEAIVAAPAIAK